MDTDKKDKIMTANSFFWGPLKVKSFLLTLFFSLFFSLILFVLVCLMAPHGNRENGNRMSCAYNLKQIQICFVQYYEKFASGPPRWAAGNLRGSVHLKALLFGSIDPKTGEENRESALLKSPKLFCCPSDDVTLKTLEEFRALKPEEWSRYCSYVMADGNLITANGDEMTLADDAQNATGEIFQGTGSQDDAFRGYGQTKPFYSHQEGGLGAYGDDSVVFQVGLDGILKATNRAISAIDPKRKDAVTLYH